MILKTIGAVMLVLCAGAITGCATIEQQPPLVYLPVVTATGGTGELFLSLNGDQWNEPLKVKRSRFLPKIAPETVWSKRNKVTSRKITLVKVLNSKGRIVGTSVMPAYSGDVLVDALNQELRAAGYTVNLVRKLARNVRNGIDISLISADLEQTSRLLTIEGSCSLQVKVDIWRNGAKIGTHEYVSNISDYSFAELQQFSLELLMKATQNIMVASVPDIIKVISAPQRR